MNVSVNCSTLVVLNHSIVTDVASVFAMLLIPPINIYVLLLIVRGSVETITSEFYRLNLAVSEILMCLYCLCKVINSYHDVQALAKAAFFFLNFLNISRPLFQGCICVERYVAVIHPVTFLRYKLLRYKIMCSSVVWFITLVFSVYSTFFDECGDKIPLIITIFLGFYIVLFSLMLFCCVSVLLALKQPGPGEGGRQRAEGYDAKRRAFKIIMITTVVTVINYLPYVVILALAVYINSTSYQLAQIITLSAIILSGLLPPLFYLQRAGKCLPLNFLMAIKCTTNK